MTHPVPPPDPEPLPPEESFRRFFGFRGMTEDHFQEAFAKVTRKEMGLHLFLMGGFWHLEVCRPLLDEFYDFVVRYRISVKVTWNPCWPGGPSGFYVQAAPPDQCSLIWTEQDWSIRDLHAPGRRSSPGSKVTETRNLIDEKKVETGTTQLPEAVRNVLISQLAEIELEWSGRWLAALAAIAGLALVLVTSESALRFITKQGVWIGLVLLLAAVMGFWRTRRKV